MLQVSKKFKNEIKWKKIKKRDKGKKDKKIMAYGNFSPTVINK